MAVLVEPTKRLEASILLVEDDPDTLEILSQLLEDTGYVVERAESVAVALQRAASQSFDLVISDIGLPDATGIDLITELRARGNATKAIAISGFGAEGDVQRALSAGFTAHLIKPISVDQLMALVSQLTSG
jgi:hypothetical protein